MAALPTTRTLGRGRDAWGQAGWLRAYCGLWEVPGATHAHGIFSFTEFKVSFHSGHCRRLFLGLGGAKPVQSAAPGESCHCAVGLLRGGWPCACQDLGLTASSAVLQRDRLTPRRPLAPSVAVTQ